MTILLSEGFGAKSVQIPQAPVHTTLLLQHFNQHKSSSNRKFTDVLMPVSNTLFGRPLRIVYDEGLANMYSLQPEMPAVWLWSKFKHKRPGEQAPVDAVNELDVVVPSSACKAKTLAAALPPAPPPPPPQTQQE